MAGWSDRGSRHARGYGSQWVRTRAWVMHVDDYLCQPCKREGRLPPRPATDVDHILPKSMGGDDSADNLEAICTECHKAKTQRDRAEAQGRTTKPRLRFDAAGFPIWPE